MPKKKKSFPSNCGLNNMIANEVENSKGTNTWWKLNIIFCGTENNTEIERDELVIYSILINKKKTG